MADAVRSGQVADPTLPADQRLLNRVTQFLLTKIDGPRYLSLIREFAGDDAVQGTTVYMDTGEESETPAPRLLHSPIYSTAFAVPFSSAILLPNKIAFLVII